jgi:hypothetical protein
VAAALRTVDLDRFPLWWDEGNNAYLAHAPLGEILRASRATLDTDPPAHRLALKAWMALWGYSPAALRSLSALCGVLTVALTYVWGRWLRGPKVALLAAGMLAIWPMHIYYSREGKGYAWVALLACLSLYIWQRYLDGAPRWRFAPWLSASLAGALALGAHYYVLALIAAQGVGLSITVLLDGGSRADALRRIRRWLSVQVATVALVAPWAVLTWASALNGARRLPETQGMAGIVAYGRQSGAALSATLGAPEWAALLAAVALAGACLGSIWRRGKGAPEPFLAAGIIVPVALGFGALQAVPFVRPRFFLYVLPLLALLAAGGIVRLRRFGLVAGLALAIAWAASLPAAYRPYDQPTEDLGPIAAALVERARPGDAIIGTYIWQEGILRLLAPGAPVTYVLGWFDEQRVPQQMGVLLAQHRRLWLLSYGVGPQDSANPAGWWLEQHTARAALTAYPPNTLTLYLTAPPPAEREGGEALFANGVTLADIGVPAEATAGDALAVSLRWRVERPPVSSVSVFLHLVDAQGALICQSDGAPRNGLAPFEAAAPNAVIDDARGLLVPAHAAAGEYRLLVGLYDPATGERVRLIEGGSSGDNALPVGVVSIEATPP